MLNRILYSFFGLTVVILVIFGVMLAWPMYEPDPNHTIELIPAERLPETNPNTNYTARDGQELPLRVFPADGSDTALIMLHGGGGYGVYMNDIATFLSSQSIASVYVPDVRGHGKNPERRGDIDYKDQLEDDLADLVEHIREQKPQAQIVVGGHSAGGGLALRLAGSEQANNIDGYLLLAPFLGLEAPTNREDNGGYVHIRLPRAIILSLLNAAGITALDGLEAIYFNRPEPYLTDHHTLSWSWRLTQGIGPRDYAKDLSAIDVPLLLVVGENDDIFIAGEYGPIITEHAPHGEVVVKPGLNHVEDILRDPRSLDTYAAWLQEL